MKKAPLAPKVWIKVKKVIATNQLEPQLIPVAKLAPNPLTLSGNISAIINHIIGPKLMANPAIKINILDKVSHFTSK